MTAATGFAALRRLIDRPSPRPPDPHWPYVAVDPAAGPATGFYAEGGRVEGRGEEEPAAAPERCELCGEPVKPAHRHLLDVQARQLRCACRACALLFDRSGAGGGHYRLVSDRRWHLTGFALDDAEWERLRIPVHLAFFFHDSAAGRVVAFYPSPGGAVESLLEMTDWAAIERRNPVLGEMRHDVEALLVNRSRGAASHWLVPVDDCYRLAGLIRAGWKGLAGGQEVWDDITRFFDGLRGQATTVSRDGTVRPAAARPGTANERGEQT